MSTQPGSARELEWQFGEIAAVLRGRWVPSDAAGPRVLTVSAYDEARRFNKRGGWTGVDPPTLHAVHRGARPGDPLPPLEAEPYIRHVTDGHVPRYRARPAETLVMRVAVTVPKQVTITALWFGRLRAVCAVLHVLSPAAR